MVLLEICCESPAEVAITAKYNIDRIELSSNLHDYGMTPTLGALLQSKRITNIPIVCSVRPRTGGFVYNKQEFELMIKDAKILLDNGADGLVFGCLTEEDEINVEQTKFLTKIAHHYNKEAIFHRAFDCVKDYKEAYRLLEEIGVDRIITGGLKEAAYDGVDVLKELVEMGEIEILAGGGIVASNVEEIIEKAGLTQVHASCRKIIEDPGNHPLVKSAVSKEEHKGKLLVIDEKKVQDLVSVLKE